MKMIEKLGDLVSKYMAILIVLMVGYCFIKPETFSWALPNMGNFLTVMMFGVGMTIKAEQFKLVLERPKDVFIGALGQFTIMPIVAYTLSKLFNLSPELTLGLILVGCCPGGISSNVMTFIAKGDVALSVSLTTVSTLLAPIATPIITLILANSQIEVAAGNMFVSIIKTVIIPIVAAVVITKFLPKVSEFMNRVLPLLSSVLLMLLVSGSISGNIESLKSSGVIIVLAVLLHHTIGHFLGYYMAYKFGCDKTKRRAICLEVGMQNSGLANTLAVAHFTPVVSVAAAISGPLQTVLDAILANYWSNRSVEEIVESIEVVEA